ncbi:Spy/CpxP family protein refolding chaperone [Pseudoalteromonas sp.]|uniref:Spy/CpxP family protein refolding chaperone n=1 Tax=Pseudoalteromonas sp. TaxID=53249 RepID=UPI003569EE1D
MNLKLLLSAAVISIAAFASTVLEAKPHKAGLNIYRMLLSERAVERLDLTVTQQEKIKTIAESEKAAIEVFKKAHPNKRDEIKALVHAETFDESAFRQVFAKGHSERVEMAVLKAKNKNAVWNTLTSEQQDKFEKMMKKRKAKMAKKHKEKD